MSDRRDRLPNRRASETFDFVHDEHRYTATLGYYPDGRLGEIFLRSGRTGTALSIATMEVAIALSFALQHGCSVETMREAFPRTAEGAPEGVAGALLAKLAERDKGPVKVT